ncbi:MULTISPECIES: hypothetical protein [unclassified Brevundimonas]|uniref:hypothetical protein n=1 Tax=unclassified Brevundimonas TaxID=2622653 RepID=UPI0025C0E7AA|nr:MULTISPECIES: hypothetical protein [unclassified Brevundimonas]
MSMHAVKSSKGVLRRLMGAGAACLALMAAATPALADWTRFESPRFVLYSSGNATEAREMLEELEKFDRIMRMFMGQDLDGVPYRKLPIYLVSGPGLRTIRPDGNENIAGFYIPTDEDIFAVATRGSDNHTLKHEYAHHFMYQEFSYPYPGWFIEGFAEYYAPTLFKRNETHVGVPSPGRASALSYLSWMSMNELLANRPLTKARNSDSYYPLAWLLTHWFMGDATRRTQLHTYLSEVGAGGDPVEVMQKVTGLDAVELRRTLRRYMNSRVPYMGVRTTFPDIQITSERLPASADDLLLLGQQLKMGVSEERRAQTLQTIRQRAARYPDDPLALLVHAHAELHNGNDPEKAASLLEHLLSIDPNNVEGMQYLVRAKLDLADKAFEADDQEGGQRLKREAQSLLARAYQIDDANYITMLLMSENRRTDATYPTDNDMQVLEIAYTLAPQLGQIRYNYAAALLHKGRNDEAITIITPLVNNPHGENPAAKDLLLRAKGQTEAEAAAEEEAIKQRAAQEGEDEGEGTSPPQA